MPGQALVQFCRSLGTMLNAGVPIGRCLRVLSRESRGRTARAAGRIQAVIEAGGSFADGAAEEPHIFSPLHVRLLRAAERSGHLDRVLTKMADDQERSAQLMGSILTKLIYPAFLLHAGILIPGVITWFRQGPSAAVFQVLIVLVPLYAILIGGYLAFTRKDRFHTLRRLLDTFLFHCPIIGSVVRKTCTARFARTFGALYNAGVNVLEALPLAAEATGNMVMEERIQRAMPFIQEGGNLPEALQATHAFAPMVENMLATGAESGKLDEMLAKISEHAEFEARAGAERLASFIPFLIYLLLAFYVGLQIIAIGREYVNTLNSALSGR